MLKPTPHFLIVVTMLFAFIGQATASHLINPINQHSDSYVSTESVAPLVHNDTQKMNSDTDIDDCCDVDCCENDCICPANICSNFAYVHTQIHSHTAFLPNKTDFKIDTKQPNAIINTLYRPPIFTS